GSGFVAVEIPFTPRVLELSLEEARVLENLGADPSNIRFQPVKVPEPSVDETIQILKFLPDKAIDLIDEAGSR
uniref:ATP-dependent Clp protease ATP-binding subunit ClpA homolog (Fragments) n=1 Tax=Populus euphratica TaxID=75702 RepID=CLPA_POPEU|nr:RecName: Full=ATP-dependent Clp protease ATP-binding subunit ClpA homolog [Populus euphratica]